MLPIWDNLRLVYTPGQIKLDEAKVAQFCKYLQSYFHPNVCNNLQKAIVEGPVGMDDEKKDGDFRGTFPKRVQQWFLKTHDVQFSDKSNIINDLLGKLNKNMVTEPLYAMFEKKIEWTAGDFGDSGSCYWGCNAITRYFLSNWNCFRAFKFYTRHAKSTKEGFENNNQFKGKQWYWQDGYIYKGFGRVLTAVDFPSQDMFLMWNAYPAGDLVHIYQQAFLEGIGQDNPDLRKKLKSKQVAFVNQGQGGGWFYTNNRCCMLIAEQKLLDTVGSSVDLGYQGTPDKTKLNEYAGECQHCNKRGIWKDRPSIDGVVCEYCLTNHAVTCHISGKRGFGPAKQNYTLMELPSAFKLVQDIITGRNYWVCPEEFEKLDTKKYTSPLLQKKLKLEPAMLAAMPDMEDDDDGEDMGDFDYRDYEEDEYEDD